MVPFTVIPSDPLGDCVSYPCNAWLCKVRGLGPREEVMLLKTYRKARCDGIHFNPSTRR